jgi:hypothetical protein
MNKVVDEEESDFGGTRADNDMTTDQEPVKLFRFKFRKKDIVLVKHCREKIVILISNSQPFGD